MGKSILSDRLIYLREKHNYTKTEFIKKIGITNLSTYANWEYGLREPEIDNIVKIAKVYNVSVDFLLGLTDSEYNNEERFLSNVKSEELKRWYISIGEIVSDKDLDKLYKIWNIIKEN